MNIVDLVEKNSVSAGVYEVLKALPEGTMQAIVKRWCQQENGYFDDLWDEVAWDVAKDTLWHDSMGIINEPLSFILIKNVMEEYIESMGGINAAFSNWSRQPNDPELWGQADDLLVGSLWYCLKEAMTQRNFCNFVNRLWITTILQKNLGGNINLADFEELYDGLLNEVDTEMAVYDFIETVKAAAKKHAGDSYNITVTLRGGALSLAQLMNEIARSRVVSDFTVTKK